MGTEFDEFESFQAVASQGFRLLSLFGCNKQSQRISSDLEGKGILLTTGLVHGSTMENAP